MYLFVLPNSFYCVVFAYDVVLGFRAGQDVLISVFKYTR